MNPLPLKFNLDPSPWLEHEIKELVLFQDVLYIKHQVTKFLDIIPHGFDLSKSL